MELVRGLYNISRRHLGCVLTVGNYDGVHLGHQQMIGVLKARADHLLVTQMDAVVIAHGQHAASMARHDVM